MLKSIKDARYYKKVFAEWHQKFDPQAPKAGDLAPDFELWDVTGERKVRLSDFYGRKPVVLVFGSFT